MKYLILMYGLEGAWGPDEAPQALQESIDRCHDLAGKGQYIFASPLQSATTATCLRIEQGKRLLSDGPFAETKEQLGGFFLIDVDNLDEAIAFASRVPGTTRGVAEIRPLKPVDGLPGAHPITVSITHLPQST